MKSRDSGLGQEVCSFLTMQGWFKVLFSWTHLKNDYVHTRWLIVETVTYMRQPVELQNTESYIIDFPQQVAQQKDWTWYPFPLSPLRKKINDYRFYDGNPLIICFLVCPRKQIKKKHSLHIMWVPMKVIKPHMTKTKIEIQNRTIILGKSRLIFIPIQFNLRCSILTF